MGGTDPAHAAPLAVDALAATGLTLDVDAVATPEVAEYALWLGDDALILAQQLGG